MILVFWSLWPSWISSIIKPYNFVFFLKKLRNSSKKYINFVSSLSSKWCTPKNHYHCSLKILLQSQTLKVQRNRDNQGESLEIMMLSYKIFLLFIYWPRLQYSWRNKLMTSVNCKLRNYFSFRFFLWQSPTKNAVEETQWQKFFVQIHITPVLSFLKKLASESGLGHELKGFESIESEFY